MAEGNSHGDVDFESFDPVWERIAPRGARGRRIAAGFAFTEGPVWAGDCLLFADIPRSRIVRWSWRHEGPEVTTYRHPSKLANGLAFDRDRRLVACEGATRRVARTEPNGATTVIADHYQGKRLNSPNDVIVAADGSVYFSDPYWGHFFADPGEPQVRLEDRELPFQGLFRAAPDGNVTLLADDFGFPNGLAISPDGATLYVDDSDVGHIRAFDLLADGAVANSRVFAEIGPPETGHVDGMKIDREGNLYCTGPGGIWVLDPTGTLLGRIRLPDSPSNLAWGEPDWRALFVTCRDSVFRVRLGIPGVPDGLSSTSSDET